MSVVLAVEAIIMAAIVAVTLTVFHTHAKRSTFVGAFCVAFGIVMYALPLTVTYKVCRDKSVDYMPFWLSFTGFANGIVWVAYALLQFDLNILISNGTGAVLGAIQLLLWTFYRQSIPNVVLVMPDRLTLRSWLQPKFKTKSNRLMISLNEGEKREKESSEKKNTGATLCCCITWYNL
uniref:Uncharacterized protein n=1 Tax=Kalanchoe fedtschenkoi TaxID=63787 RepID=A0A7N0U4L9_KALFE